MEFSEYAAHDGVGLAELVSKGEVSAAELLAAAQARTDEVNPRINAVVRRLDAGPRAAGPLEGPFAGVPFLLKDLHQFAAGEVTSGGSRARAAWRSDVTDTVVQRWLDTGLVVFGRTNTPEFGAKGVTEPDLFGPARNPWDPSRTPGGSSGGAAAAVAAGIVPVAAASDGGGSIRIPASCCGLFGLKPGRGVVPFGPSYGEPLHGAVSDGVISRSVRDTAAMLEVLTGSPYRSEPEREPGRLRIGVATGSTLTPVVDADAQAAVDDAVALLRGLGHDVEPADPGYDDAALARDFLLPWFVHVAVEVAEAGGGPDFELDTKVMAAIGRATPAVELEEALARWHTYVLALAQFHTRFDLLLTPTTARAPIRIGALDTPWYEQLGARLVLGLRAGALFRKLPVVDNSIRRNLSWVPYTQLANLTGRPAASVPLHWTAAGLPLGVQFVAPPGGERTLLRLAAQLETARPWADRRPAL